MIFVSTFSKNIDTKVLNSVIFEDGNKQRICMVECVKCGSRFLNAEEESELKNGSKCFLTLIFCFAYGELYS